MCPLALIQTKTSNIFGMSKITFSVDVMRRVICRQSFMYNNLQTSTFAYVTVLAEMEKGQ